MPIREREKNLVNDLFCVDNMTSRLYGKKNPIRTGRSYHRYK